MFYDAKYDYLSKWNQSFSELNHFPLKELFIMPEAHTLKGQSINLTNIFGALITGSIQNLLIVGKLGSGKTSLISYFLAKYGRDYPIVVLNGRSMDLKHPEIYPEKYSELSQKILIIDDIDQIQFNFTISVENILDFLYECKNNNIRLIATSRNKNLPTEWMKLFYTVILEDFTEEQLKAFLTKFSHNLTPSNYRYIEENISSWQNELQNLRTPLILTLFFSIMSKIDIEQCKNSFDLFRVLITYNLTQDDQQFYSYVASQIFIKRKYYLQDLSELPPNNKISHFAFLTTDANNQISFIHKVIYEYFLAKWLYDKVITLEDYCSDEYIFNIFSYADLSSECLYNVQNFLTKCSNKIKNKLFYKWIKLLSFLLYPKYQNLKFHLLSKLENQNIIEAEVHIFYNVFEICQILMQVCPLKKLPLIHDPDAIINFKNYIAFHSVSSNQYSLNLSNIDLSKFDFQGLNLNGANFENSILNGANFSHCNLSYANLRGAVIQDACLRDSILTFTDLSYANLSKSTLQNAKMDYAKLEATNFHMCDLSNCDMRNANLAQANLYCANLREAICTNCNFSSANLNMTFLWKVTFRDSDLHNCNLSQADLSYADLRGCDLSKSNFIDCNTTSALF